MLGCSCFPKKSSLRFFSQNFRIKLLLKISTLRSSVSKPCIMESVKISKKVCIIFTRFIFFNSVLVDLMAFSQGELCHRHVAPWPHRNLYGG